MTTTATRKPRKGTRTSTASRAEPVSLKDIDSDVTGRIIALLEQGTVIWHQPWKASTAAGLPMNLSSKRPYRGINVFILEFEAQMKGYESPYWASYKQISERGGQIRRSEKSTQVVFWKILRKDVEVNGEIVSKRIPLLRAYNVFNVEQADWGEGAKLPQVAERIQVDPVEAAEALVADYLSTGPSLRHGGDRACYQPVTDNIQMPHRDDFSTGDHYYSTLFHEVTHSTGHSKRLARPGIAEGTFGKFGDPIYSREELVAEMGAAMLSTIAGVDQTTIAASASYLAHWRDVLKADNKIIIQAAAQAQKAVDLVLGTTFDNDQEEEES